MNCKFWLVSSVKLRSYNKAQQADLRQLSPFVQKTAQKAPVTSGGCARRYARKRHMRLLILLLISFPAFAEYEFEKSKFHEGITCKGMNGVWYTDVTVSDKQDGTVRHITKLVRNNDGTAFLKGLSIYLDKNENSPWEFSSKWSCKDNWYVEKNEWGYTAFKILSLGSENLLKDQRGNLGSGPIDIVEKNSLELKDAFIEKYFGQ